MIRTGSIAAVALSTSVLLGVVAAPGPEPPSDERIPQLAEQLAEFLLGESVVAPDGSRVSVVGGAKHSTALLDAGRIEACLATVGAADAWPEAWLVIQVAESSFDLILPVRLGDDGDMEQPDPVFAAARQDWSVDALRDAIREATGRKPKGRHWNLVVQGFRTRIEQRYVYDPPADRRGLLALLPEGTLLREARRVELTDGRRYTLALVMREAEFVPSTCSDCESWVVGHADTGRMLFVLTDEAEVLDEMDLESVLTPEVDRVLLPRYRCEERDGEPARQELSIDQRFGGRELVTLIRLRDSDGDGHDLEIELPLGVEGCEARTVVLGVGPVEARLRIVGD